jgi:nucleoside phosphorylase
MAKLRIDLHKDVLNEKYILILTANSIEKAALNKILSYRSDCEINMKHRGCSIGKINNFNVVHITGTSGISSPDSISRLAIEFLSKERFPTPKAVILFGFCWGVPEKTWIGDTLISNKIMSFNSRKDEPHGVTYKPEKYISSLAIPESLLENFTPLIYKRLLGTLASLESLISNGADRDKILKYDDEIIGGEMEAFGIVPSLDQIPWLIVKNVSDYACKDFSRVGQEKSAQTGAEHLPKIVSKIVEANELDIFPTEKDQLHIDDILTGNALALRRDHRSSDELNDYLNDIIGPLLAYKLERYSSTVEYEKTFPREMCRMILEIVQNSFRHGGSTRATISLSHSKITIEEDKESFDIRTISGTNGGAQTWINRIEPKYIKTNQVIYTKKGNAQTFHLPRVHPGFRKIVLECTATIVQKTIRSGYAQEIFEYNRDCESIFFDATRTMMMSRALSITDELSKILSEGKTVYLLCEDYELEMYQNLFKEKHQSLKLLTK